MKVCTHILFVICVETNVWYLYSDGILHPTFSEIVTGSFTWPLNHTP